MQPRSSRHDPRLGCRRPLTQRLAGQVRGLEFNGLSPNLLASGGSDGELCIWDVAVPSAPNLYPGLKVCASSQYSLWLGWSKEVWCTDQTSLLVVLCLFGCANT